MTDEQTLISAIKILRAESEKNYIEHCPLGVTVAHQICLLETALYYHGSLSNLASDMRQCALELAKSLVENVSN